MVMVYHFEVWNHGRGENIVLPHKCDANFIEQVGGTILHGTGEEVDPGALDAAGRYDPNPTGQDIGKELRQSGENGSSQGHAAT
jgi:hypothetical protein